MNLFENKADCYGCGACLNICPKSAISMKIDEQGFRYPTINTARCVECGLCAKACQILKETEMLNMTMEDCYGVKNNDSIRQASSSGGVYTAISDYILKKEGACVGVSFDKNMKVVHKIAYSECERDLFRGSKYVQSDTGWIYADIERILNSKKYVLFTGTPCQVGGLKQYLNIKGTDCSRLLLNDIICHGVSSPRVWDEYISFLEKQYGSKINSYSFRNKNIGWKGYHICAKFDDGQVMMDNTATQSFIRIFSRDIMLRPSCYKCPYASLKRTGDITIGDFWGIEKIDYAFNDNSGISLVLVNTGKGEKLFKNICKNERMKIRMYSTAKLTQPNLYRHTSKGAFYDDFWKVFHLNGYIKVAKKYGGYGTGQFLFRLRDSILYKSQLLKGKKKT